MKSEQKKRFAKRWFIIETFSRTVHENTEIFKHVRKN